MVRRILLSPRVATGATNRRFMIFDLRAMMLQLEGPHIRPENCLDDWGSALRAANPDHFSLIFLKDMPPHLAARRRNRGA
ncbi:MAG: hypothetical protein KDA73_10910 [Rhodobacteraceae bacterium]|nr:hypothetical protein [Paracoccaceae bacterium]